MWNCVNKTYIEMGTNEQRTQMVGKEMGGSSVGTI
jgi:hypothetical protein